MMHIKTSTPYLREVASVKVSEAVEVLDTRIKTLDEKNESNFSLGNKILKSLI